VANTSRRRSIAGAFLVPEFDADRAVICLSKRRAWRAPQLTVRLKGSRLSKLAFRRARPGTVSSAYPFVIKMHLNVEVFTRNNTLIEVLFPSGDDFF
jgi:hypothetical protein